MARETYLEIGGLDERRFPAGYNDLDFMLRASARGLRHLYLGHVGARHARGSSRTGDNEDLQALWLNQTFPVAPAERTAQLEAVRVETAREERRPADAGAAELRAKIAARQAEELARAETAGSLARAADLVRRLERELSAPSVSTLRVDPPPPLRG